MSLTQFAMVEELACLIKDNLPCKHLILSVEEALVDFLKDDMSSDGGVLELEPMNSYNRLLLHRLADIFGFSHQSVGEGDDRHLIFERCPETSVPSILVSDLLWQYDEVQSPSVSQQILSRRWEATSSPELEKKRGGGRVTCEISLEERETAYLAARERIFSMEEEEVGPTRLNQQQTKKKPQSNPVVARRMIAHALGQRMAPSPLLPASVQPQQTNTTSQVVGEEALLKQQQQVAEADKGKTEITQKDHLKQQEQHIGAAKRMFANALGFPSTRHDGHALVMKTTKRASSE